MSDQHWMQLAYHEAEAAKLIDEVPVGAVIISPDGDLLAAAGNRVVSNQDPCAHAEILAIRMAAANLLNYRLDDCQMYVTLEPCVMCAGAIVHARIKRLVFATRDLRAGAAGSVYNLLRGAPLNHQVVIDEGIMQQESAELLEFFFKQRR